MKGYKVLDHDWRTMNGLQWEVGKTYRYDPKSDFCKTGFHFHKNLTDCFRDYEFDPRYKVVEVEALGKIKDSGYICTTNKLKIVHEIPWKEVLANIDPVIFKSITGIDVTDSDLERI